MLEINLCSVYSLEMSPINEIDNKFLLNQINQSKYVVHWLNCTLKQRKEKNLMNNNL